MIKRVLFAALVVAAPVRLVSAQDAKVSVHMMGIGGDELRSLAVYARASIRRSRLDLRFLDGTQLRCCSKRSNTGENRRGGDSGRSPKDMRSANVADIGQRRMDHLSWV